MDNGPKLIPELIVSNLGNSLEFWCEVVGFKILYERPKEGFVYLTLDNAHLMLEQRDLALRDWASSILERPFGRGINLEIEVPMLEKIIEVAKSKNMTFFLSPEERWYRQDAIEVGQLQCILSDPDGYLARLIKKIGTRTIV